MYVGNKHKRNLIVNKYIFQTQVNVVLMDIFKIVEKYATPFFLVDSRCLLENARKFKSLFNAVIAYSYKTNYIPAICSIFHDEGLWAEVVSGFEYSIAKSVNAPDIVFNGPYKTRDELRRAIEDNALINADSFSEVKLLESMGANRIGVRISSGKRFGIKEEDLKKLDVNITALHAHIGTNIMDPIEYRKTLSKLIRISELLEKQGMDIKYIDIGGGFATTPQLMPYREPPSLEEYASAINIETDKTIIIEPGRALVNPGISLITRVVSIKKPWVFVDAGTNLLPSAPYLYHNIRALKQGSKQEEYDIAGPMCYDSDVLGVGRMLPELEVGDILVIEDAGAYSVSMSRQFMMPRPPVVLLDNGKTSLIRRRETAEDILRLDVK